LTSEVCLFDSSPTSQPTEGTVDCYNATGIRLEHIRPMPRRDVKLITGEYYYLYNRGSNREAIFREWENYRFFLRRIRRYLLPSLHISAYCRMPTHYHLLTRANSDGVSQAIQWFTISYTKAFNKRYGPSRRTLPRERLGRSTSRSMTM